MSDGDAPGALLLMIQFRRAEFLRELMHSPPVVCPAGRCVKHRSFTQGTQASPVQSGTHGTLGAPENILHCIRIG